MPKTVDLENLMEQKADFEAELLFFEKQGAPKSMLEKKRKAIDAIAAILSDNESQVKCNELLKALEPLKEKVAATVKDKKATFPVNIRFRFENGELSKFTVSASVAGSGSGSGTRTTGKLTYNGKEFPAQVSCNYSAQKEFKVSGKLEKGLVCNSYEQAFQAVLGIIPDAKKLYDSEADSGKYHSSSAHDRLNRMFKIDVDTFFDREGTVNGPTK